MYIYVIFFHIKTIDNFMAIVCCELCHYLIVVGLLLSSNVPGIALSYIQFFIVLSVRFCYTVLTK